MNIQNVIFFESIKCFDIIYKKPLHSGKEFNQSVTILCIDKIFQYFKPYIQKSTHIGYTQCMHCTSTI